MREFFAALAIVATLAGVSGFAMWSGDNWVERQIRLPSVHLGERETAGNASINRDRLL